MIHRIAAGITLSFVAANASLAQPQKSPAPTTAPNKQFMLTAEEQTVLDLVNAERKKEKLDSLKANDLLTKAARDHSANMAKQGKLAHELDNKKPADRLTDLGYKHNGWAENVAHGQRTPAAAMQTWMNSEGHKKNILGSFTEFGVGIAIAADGSKYWTQVFATPAGR